MKLRRLKYRLRQFFKDDIWALDMEELSRARARFIKYLKVAMITIKTFSSEKIGFQAVALSFYTIMAFVPFIAVTFAISDYFNFGDYLRELIYLHFSSKEIINQVLLFANNIIN